MRKVFFDQGIPTLFWDADTNTLHVPPNGDPLSMGGYDGSVRNGFFEPADDFVYGVPGNTLTAPLATRWQSWQNNGARSCCCGMTLDGSSTATATTNANGA
jgi:hypothetical protein